MVYWVNGILKIGFRYLIALGWINMIIHWPHKAVKIPRLPQTLPKRSVAFYKFIVDGDIDTP